MHTLNQRTLLGSMQMRIPTNSLWLRHEPLQSLSLRFGTNSFLLLDSLYQLVSEVSLFVLSRLLSSLWVSRAGSAYDWCALQEALYKCIDTIQYNKRSL